MRSVDGGAVWTPVRNVSGVMAFGFGAKAPGSSFATIYVVGRVNNEYGIWRSTNNAASWTKIGEYPYTIDWITTISGDKNVYGTVYIGFAGSSFVYGKPA